MWLMSFMFSSSQSRCGAFVGPCKLLSPKMHTFPCMVWECHQRMIVCFWPILDDVIVMHTSFSWLFLHTYLTMTHSREINTMKVRPPMSQTKLHYEVALDGRASYSTIESINSPIQSWRLMGPPFTWALLYHYQVCTFNNSNCLIINIKKNKPS